MFYINDILPKFNSSNPKEQSVIDYVLELILTLVTEGSQMPYKFVSSDFDRSKFLMHFCWVYLLIYDLIVNSLK